MANWHFSYILKWRYLIFWIYWIATWLLSALPSPSVLLVFPHIRSWVPANFTLRLQFAFDSSSRLLFLLFRYSCWPGSDLRFGAVWPCWLAGAGLGGWDTGGWLSVWFARVPEPDERWSVLIEMICFIYILSFQIKSVMEMKWYEIWRPRRRVIKIRRALVWDVDLKFWDKDSDERVWWLLSENFEIKILTGEIGGCYQKIWNKKKLKK